jgi:hypothetical protein
VKRRIFALCWIALALSGCMTARERQAQAIQNMDASDDAYCRKQADRTVNYDQCRKNLMQLRQAAVVGAGAVDVGNSMKQAGAYLQSASSPPSAPTVCTSTPWAGSVRTTCQ